jgi:hypothetical protein
MAYTINKTDGTIIATVVDGQINQSSTSITLIGKNFSGFGEYLNENLIKILENFASTGVEPTPALTGQLWYDLEENRVKVYSGTEWKAVGTSALAATRPLDISTGDFWFSTVDNQLYFYDGSRDYLIGPDYSSSQGQSGLKVETIEDSSRRNRTIVTLYIGGEIGGFFSTVEFTPRFPIPNYTANIIKIGFNPLNDAFKFVGTSNNSDKLGNVEAVFYARKNQATIFTEQLTVSNDQGIRWGSGPQGQAGVESGGDVYFRNSSNNFKMAFKVTKNNNSLTAMTIEPSSTGDDVINIFQSNANSQVNVGGSMTVAGDLTVEGATIIIQSETLTLKDKNIELAVPSSGSPSDISADGGGLILKGNTDHSILWDNATNTWVSTESIDIPSLGAYKIDGVSVLEDTGVGIQLSVAVTSAPGVTSFGILNNLTIDNLVFNSNIISNNGTTLPYPDGGNSGGINATDLHIEPRGNLYLDGATKPKLIGIQTTNENSINQTVEAQEVLTTAELSEATSKKYVTNLVRSRSIALTMDVTGRGLIGYDSDEPVGLTDADVETELTSIAPVNEYEVGTIARIATWRYFLENIPSVSTVGSTLDPEHGEQWAGGNMIATETLYDVTGALTPGGTPGTYNAIKEVAVDSQIPTQKPPRFYVVRGLITCILTQTGPTTIEWVLDTRTEDDVVPGATGAGISSFIRPLW